MISGTYTICFLVSATMVLLSRGAKWGAPPKFCVILPYMHFGIVSDYVSDCAHLDRLTPFVCGATLSTLVITTVVPIVVIV